MVVNDLDDLYRDPILDHCRHPRNPDLVESPDLSGQAVNPFCGDEVDLQIVLDNGHVARVGAQGRGCAINQASTSMLSEAIRGKTIKEIEELSNRFKEMMRGPEPSEVEIQGLDDLRSLSGVRQFPVRIKCALLCWSALEEAIDAHRKGQGAVTRYG